MSNSVSHSIFHQTLLCQTVAEYQSKVNSCGNALFQPASAIKGSTQAKRFLLSTNFRGNRFCVRKRKQAMGRNNQQIPCAVLTTNPASEVCSSMQRNMLIVVTSFGIFFFFFFAILILIFVFLCYRENIYWYFFDLECNSVKML